jgi:predicted ester cyclase
MDGDLVTAVVTASGTHQVAIMGVAPTGNQVTFSQIDVWRVKEGKITDVWHNFANADILLQIGYQLVPPTQ